MTRTELPAAIPGSRLIAVFRGLHPDRVVAVADVLDRAGIGVLEVTMDSPVAERSIERLASRSVVGAGTVMNVAEAEAAVAAGAAFLVSPHTDLDVVEWAVDRGVPVLPGAFTPTEIMVAWNAGAAAVKVFPASVAGPGLLKAVGGPMAGIPLIPTGGVTAENAAAYLEAGAIAVGLGGWLTGHADLDVVAERAAATVESAAASSG
ncbi:MAG: bifunctional 4-hydroxy-2-oxoglutarate aldolase/2-dehydro-3-deoxy-phosphogluconate aldolase [Acidimicrobiia bacterium]